ncbi:MAG: membrane dipeptidase [Acidobacteriota bacterium]
MISRRSALAGGVCALAAPFVNRGQFSLFARDTLEYSTRTVDLVRENTVIDMLGLLTLDYRKLAAVQTQELAFPQQEFDLLKHSGVNVIHPAVGFTKGDIRGSSAADLTRWNHFVATYADRFLRVDTPADLERTKTSGKIGVILGLQNSAHFETLADVDTFYAMGQRVSQLTYTNNALGGGSGDPRRGLTPYGSAVVDRMNRLGMAVDVSHCSDRTTLDAIATSRKPVLVTHSNCRTLVPSSGRCKTDEAIRNLAASGGVFGITLVRGFVRPGGSATIEDALQHIDHVIAIAGVEHVGLGTDVDQQGRDRNGAARFDLDGANYSRKIYDLTEGLVRRNYTRADIAAILGGNFRRALGEIWASNGTAAR